MSEPLLRPHRGTLVLVLGILSIVCCGVLGVFAWVMGNADLEAMRAGQIDPQGRSLTEAGRILGIVGVVLWVLGIAAQLLFGIALIPMAANP